MTGPHWGSVQKWPMKSFQHAPLMKMIKYSLTLHYIIHVYIAFSFHFIWRNTLTKHSYRTICIECLKEKLWLKFVTTTQKAVAWIWTDLGNKKLHDLSTFQWYYEWSDHNYMWDVLPIFLVSIWHTDCLIHFDGELKTSWLSTVSSLF